MDITGYLIPAIIILILVIVFFSLVPLGLWISALAAGVKISILNLIGMRLRRVPPASIILPFIKATKADLELDAESLEAHYLAGGNVDRWLFL